MGEAAAAGREARFPIGAAATLEELDRDPHPLLARLGEREPVSWLPALGGWLITRRDLALEAMRDPETFTVDDPRFSTGRVVGPSMLTLDGAEHDRHRDPFARPFRLDAVTRVAAGGQVTPAGREAFVALRSRVEPVLDRDPGSSLAAAATSEAA